MNKKQFGRYLRGIINSIAAYEGKSVPAIEEELGYQIGVAPTTIQRYKAGHIPPEQAAIPILVEAAVKRGFVSRSWLEVFLRVAGYPAPEPLFDRFFPGSPVYQQPTPSKHNMPAPTYALFIKRPQAFDEVREALRQRSAAVILISIGGMGKTSLVREIAAYCLDLTTAKPTFDHVVWVSDRDRPGTTTMSIVLDEIARTLDYPSHTQLQHDDKRREIERLLRRGQGVLVVVDSVETITDAVLIQWLLHLPEPSKALLTSREYRRDFQQGGWRVDLSGMSEAEARELVRLRLKTLKFEQLEGGAPQITDLVNVTGGNPKAIEMALGCVKRGTQPFAEVIEDLKHARGALFEDLFVRCWGLLDSTAKQLLLTAPLFLQSISSKALEFAAGVRPYAFKQAIDCLVDLALLDVQPNLTTTPRYTLHPLVRVFAQAKQRELAEFDEQAARVRWVRWYIALAEKVGYCWEDLSKLEALDPEQETIYAVIEWTLAHEYYDEALAISKGVSFYYYARGFWDKQPPANLVRAQAARALGSVLEEIEALGYHIQVLSKQGNITEAGRLLPRLHELTQQTDLSGDIYFCANHAEGLYWLARGRLDLAQAAWRKSMERQSDASDSTYVATRQWLATCLYQQGEFAEARELFQTTLEYARERGYTQGVIDIQTKLAAIYLDQQDGERSELALAESNALAHRYRDRACIARIKRLYARLHAARGELAEAEMMLNEAIDIFERLGMRHELDEAYQARERLAEKEAGA